MSIVEANQTRKRSARRRILLLLALITPLFLRGIFLVEILPASLLPSSLDFMVNLFEAEARVDNRSGETLYITPITTTYGRPVVITQLNSFRQRDIPLQPNHSFTLTYDSADLPLSGIVVCRTNEDCRLLAVDYSDVYSVDSFENLPGVEPSWLLAVRSTPQYNFTIVLIPMSGLLPVVLFLSWLYWGRLENKRKG
jgi:hypothetical protein